jgi:hypothetical protein
VFSWFKKRLSREHRKLAFQNFEATHDYQILIHATIFGDDGANTSVRLCQPFAESFVKLLASGARPTTDDIGIALDLNKMLRLVYDEHGQTNQKPFDEFYSPFGGWDRYFEMNENELHLIEMQRQIREGLD